MHYVNLAAAAGAILLLAACADETDTVEAEGPVVIEEDTTFAEDTAPASGDELDDQVRVGGDVEIMVDESVYNRNDEEVGTVVGLVLDEDPQLIVSVGDYLDLDGKNVLVPASEIAERAEGGLTLAYTDAELQAMEEYTEAGSEG